MPVLHVSITVYVVPIRAWLSRWLAPTPVALPCPMPAALPAPARLN